MRDVDDDNDDGVAHHLVPAVPRREWARKERRKGKGGREAGVPKVDSNCETM